MALENKVITAHNLHNLMVQFEDLTLEGFRLNRKVASRRSMGNRFTVMMIRGEEEVVVVEEPVSVPEIEIDSKVEPEPAPKRVTKAKSAKVSAEVQEGSTD